jgi:hypothetical protein
MKTYFSGGEGQRSRLLTDDTADREHDHNGNSQQWMHASPKIGASASWIFTKLSRAAHRLGPAPPVQQVKVYPAASSNGI